jgi:hypothetical protein
MTVLAAPQVSPKPNPHAKTIQLLDYLAPSIQVSQGTTRATLLLLRSRVYERLDRKQAVQDLEDAYTAIESLPPESAGQGTGEQLLAMEIVGQLARADPARLEIFLPVDPMLRDHAVRELIKLKLAKHEFDSAVSLFMRITGDVDAAYAAVPLFEELPRRAAVDRQRIFEKLTALYDSAAWTTISTGAPTDLAIVLLRFWRDLPAPLVENAIDVLLKKADPEHATHVGQLKEPVSFSTPDGPVVFKSFLEFRVFQLAPILHEIDATKAEDLLAAHPNITKLLETSPEGEASLDPQTLAANSQGNHVSGFIGAAGQESVSRSAIEAIALSAKDHPDSALAAATQLSNSVDRADALEGIARETVTSDRLTARRALEKLGRLKLDPDARAYRYARAAQLYVQMRDTEAARKLIDAALAATESLYEDDADPDEPNPALRLLWPSTRQYSELVWLASKISESYARECLNAILDPESRVLVGVELAGYWEGVSPWNSTSPFAPPRHHSQSAREALSQ